METTCKQCDRPTEMCGCIVEADPVPPNLGVWYDEWQDTGGEG